jgi:hypothetical protein
MKRIFLAIWFTVLISACGNLQTESPIVLSSTDTSTPAIFETAAPLPEPSATLVPCPPEGTPIVFGNLKIFFDSGVPQIECELFSIYLGKYNAWMEENNYWTGPLEIYVFSNTEPLVNFEYDWGKNHGCNPDSKDAIRALWEERPGTQAQSFYGASFYHVFAATWPTAELNEKVAGVVGETVNQTDLNYAGSCQRFWQVPDWVQEGFPVYLARLLEAQWGIVPAEFGKDNLLGCQEALAELDSGETCVYVLGAQAFALLNYDHPDVKPFDLWEGIKEGKTFNRAFQETYGISVAEFYERFDGFRAAGYPFPTEAMADKSVCVPQSDNRVRCLGRVYIDDLPAYAFEIGFDVPPQIYEWEVESNCSIAKLGKQGDSPEHDNQILITVDPAVHGRCQAKFGFPDNREITVEFVVP